MGERGSLTFFNTLFILWLVHLSFSFFSTFFSTPFKLFLLSPKRSASTHMNFYKQAADILDRLGKKEGSIKGLTLGNAEVTDKKRMYAVICETLKRKDFDASIIYKQLE